MFHNTRREMLKKLIISGSIQGRKQRKKKKIFALLLLLTSESRSDLDGRHFFTLSLFRKKEEEKFNRFQEEVSNCSLEEVVLVELVEENFYSIRIVLSTLILELN